MKLWFMCIFDNTPSLEKGSLLEEMFVTSDQSGKVWQKVLTMFFNYKVTVFFSLREPSNNYNNIRFRSLQVVEKKTNIRYSTAN
jgi:hypothetical protein